MKAIIFDLDGTLVDSRHDIGASVIHAARSVGLRPAQSADAVAARVGEPLGALLRFAAPGIEGAQLGRACARYREHYLAHCAVRSSIYPGVILLLDRLAGARRRLACATTKRPRGARHVLAEFSLADYFETIRGTAPEMRYKPAPDVLLAAAEDLGVAPHETIYIGDTPGDLRAARAAGAGAYWAAWGYGARDECLALAPDRVLERPAELAEATAL